MDIAVDMDDVVAEYSLEVEETVRVKLPHVRPVPMHERKNFYVVDDYPEEHRKEVGKIAKSPGFYGRLSPVPGALKTLQHWRDIGIHVILLTAPTKKHPTCAQEKVAWVEYNLGSDWVDELFICRDKTMVHADYLIDDRPEVGGHRNPSWEHILYDRPYNSAVDKRRMTWENWRSVIEL